MEREVFTGQTDTDILILSFLREKDVFNVLLVNKELNKISKVESFWMNRFFRTYNFSSSHYGSPIDYKRKDETWKDFYLKFKYHSPGFSGQDLLEEASYKGDLSLIVYLLNRGIDINTRHGEALNIAVKRNHEELIKYLISHGAKIKMSTLKWICGHSSFEIIKLAVDKGANIREDKDMAMRSAAFYNRWDIVKFFINAGCDIHSNNDELLVYASRHGNEEMLNFLIDETSDINRSRVSEEYNPLYASIIYDNFGAFILLLEKGAAFDSLHLCKAITLRRDEFIKILIQKGANIREKVYCGDHKKVISALDLSLELKEYEIYQYMRNNENIQK